jgi:hypothetical protein
MDSRQPSRLVTIGRPILTCVLLLAGYYAVPVNVSASGSQVVWRTALTVVVGLLVTWLIAREVRHQLSAPLRVPLLGLGAALAAGVVFFALADYIVAVTIDDQFVGLATKTDALYFTLTTLSTVGYGDVHAVGQLARGVVSVQMVFNIVVIASGATVLSRQISARVRERHRLQPTDDD